jgi:phage replication-related protein YjqB (UPF0714/DUF867 family)
MPKPRERKQTLETEIIAALVQDVQDANYQAEIAARDSVAGDEINAIANKALPTILSHIRDRQAQLTLLCHIYTSLLNKY